ncbi:MAG: bifunctional UDP-N-acetylmuramoyl-tripeptide:D-alanyl-D-alanine ligase/alanine racemase, partial [Ferruginibacter sp.]
MQPIHFSDIANILQAPPVQQHSNPVIENLITDSRKLLFAEQSLFFAINSPQKNADSFIDTLYKKGVRNFITNSSFSGHVKYADANFIQVADVTAALQKITVHHRKQFNYPVIGITGSNGKTIVKEWLYQLLNTEYNIVRNPKSYNSQIGVPLSVWQMTEANTLAIFEAGISQPGEMEKLEKIIAPQLGAVTFMGAAHAEGFTSYQQKIDEKLKLFLHSEIVIYSADDEQLDASIKIFTQTVNPSLSLFSWGKSHKNNVAITKITRQPGSTNILYRYQNADNDFVIPFTDEAAVNNAITCCCLLLYLKMEPAAIAEKMQHLKPVEMRLELKQGSNNCSIINDSYNADVNSLAIALDFLQQQQQHSKRTVILSDVLQSGLGSETLYKNIAMVLQQKSLHRFIGIGPEISKNAAAFNMMAEKYFYNSTEEFLQQLPVLQFKDETILLKGARPFAFEKISRALEQKMHQTFLEIDLNALRHNLKTYRHQLKPQVKLMAMVKAFSYGSGSFEIANLLQHAGADYLGVAYADEGVELRKAGINLPIMVMNTEEAGFDNIVKYGLEPELYSFNILNAFKIYLQQNNLSAYKVHIKLDTGMHRLGFEEDDLEKLCSELKASPHFQIASVFSHLVASDDPAHDAFTKTQADIFFKMVTAIEATFGYSFIK